MRAADKIQSKLTTEFSPSFIQVNDDSHLHAGHAGAPDGGESHFSVVMISDKFEGASRVARQRLVYQVLSEDMATYIHALSLDLKSGSEA